MRDGGSNTDWEGGDGHNSESNAGGERNGKGKGGSKGKGVGKGKGKGKAKVVRTIFDQETEEWQKDVSKDPRVRATVFQFYGLQRRPWDTDLSKSRFSFSGFVQEIVDCLYPEKEFTVPEKCTLTHNVRPAPSLRCGIS